MLLLNPKDDCYFSSATMQWSGFGTTGALEAAASHPHAFDANSALGCVLTKAEATSTLRC